MKKIIKTILLSVFALITVTASSFFVYNYYKNENRPLRLPFLSEAPLVATTEATTLPPTTLPPTTAAPAPSQHVIDLDSLTVIDLFPLSLGGGSWDVRHCQGITVDHQNGYIYYSYTTILVKCSMEDGSIVGTVNVPGGHMGDIIYNAADKKIYCGYYAPGRKGIYVLIFDTTKITKENMAPTEDVVRSVFIREAWNDYNAKVTFKAAEDEEETTEATEAATEKEEKTITLNHRYGCSAIDGICLGPDFSGKIKGRELLTVAYGIYADSTRPDNDYQVLLQYDVSSWWNTYAKAYTTKSFHKSGPESPLGKYFVYTGNTTYGVQTMEYFDELNLWFLCCYNKHQKGTFKKFTFFAVDGDVPPEKQLLKGQSEDDEQYVLSLYQDGIYDAENGIYGWYSSYGVQGISYLCDGLFYIVRPYKAWTGKKNAICYLNAWNPDKEDPFVLAAGIGSDYSISKIIRQ
ncbi:MAG: hypothetical protein IJ262_01115 [Clostridia bacterium]|nr:hypothetical protein [Clostridia bacterium]